MKLNRELLVTYEDSSYDGDLKSCINASGLYSGMHFVIRLSRVVHEKIERLPEFQAPNAKSLPWDVLQAYSTYIHETIHWWQHIGSTVGLIQSLAYPMQIYGNLSLLDEFIRDCGPVKSIYKYSMTPDSDGHIPTMGFHVSNAIVNNFYDLDYYKVLNTRPDLLREILNEPFFESIGHTYLIAYDQFIHLLGITFDPEFKFIPCSDGWIEKYQSLRDQKVKGFYHGSPIIRYPIGLREIFEGQARFIQIQLLYYASDQKLQWRDFNDMGMFGKNYVEAFQVFLQITESKWPDEISDALVPLFLLVCDLSINPGNAFPFPIDHFKSLITEANPLDRFVRICEVIRDNYHLKKVVKDFTKEEYDHCANTIMKILNYHPPRQILETIKHWSLTEPSLIQLMKEDLTFEFSPLNTVCRVLFARFIQFSSDKLQHPNFFCWPGIFIAGHKKLNSTHDLLHKHQALFIDKKDDDGIFPTVMKGRNEANLKKTFNRFYASCLSFDMVKQWVMKEGPFEYNYRWLSEKYSSKDFEPRVDQFFEEITGVSPKVFQII